MAFEMFWFKRLQSLIGTTFGNGSIEVSGKSPEVKLTNTTVTGAGVVSKIGSSLFITNESAGAVAFATNNVERARFLSSGLFGVNTTSPTARLDVNGDIIRLRVAKTPASASDTGNQGDIAWDTDYIYVCTATDTWKRVAIATW